MASTTIRVDRDTRDLLAELSEATGQTITSTVRDAAEALVRQRFAADVTAEYDALRTDPVAWASYLAEGEATHVNDGLAD